MAMETELNLISQETQNLISDNQETIIHNLKEKIECLKEYIDIFTNLETDTQEQIIRKNLLIKTLTYSFDDFINKIEKLYYKKVLKKGKIKDMNERDTIIYNSNRAIDTFMPLIIYYNLYQNSILTSNLNISPSNIS